MIPHPQENLGIVTCMDELISLCSIVHSIKVQSSEVPTAGECQLSAVSLFAEQRWVREQRVGGRLRKAYIQTRDSVQHVHFRVHTRREVFRSC